MTTLRALVRRKRPRGRWQSNDALTRNIIPSDRVTGLPLIWLFRPRPPTLSSSGTFIGHCALS